MRYNAEMWDSLWPDAVGGCLELCCGSHIRHGVANGGEVAEMCEFLDLDRKGDVVASVRETEEFCMSCGSSLYQGQLFFLCRLVPGVKVASLLAGETQYADPTVCWRDIRMPTQH